MWVLGWELNSRRASRAVSLGATSLFSVIFNYVWACARECGCPQRPDELDPSGAVGIGHLMREIAGTQTQVI